MKTINTPQLNVHQLGKNELSVPFDLGRSVRLESTMVRRAVPVREWWIAGDFGVIQFSQATQEAAVGFLAHHGYVAKGALPPDCFEYTR